MTQPLFPPAWREGFRRHERTLAWAWVALVAGFLALLVLPPTRHWFLGRVEAGVRASEARWTSRLEEGERLLAAGDYALAAQRLDALDREFPARDVRHGRDKERERLLLALAAAYTRLEQKGRALRAAQALAAFDPLNYRNHYALALVSDHFLSGWALAPEAKDAYAAVLAIHPSHMPSMRGYVAYYAARGEWPEVRRIWEVYLDAFLLQPVTLRAGRDSVTVMANATGRAQDVEFLLPPGAAADSLRFDARGMALAIDRVALVRPLRAGAAEARTDLVLPLAAPLRGDTSLGVAAPAAAAGLERVRVTLRLFKPADKALWNSVSAAYRNLLDWDGLAAAGARIDVLPRAGLADSVLGRQEWATEGQAGRRDEQELLR